MDQDLATMRMENPCSALLENVWRTVGKDRKVTLDDVRGKGVNNPLFFIMYVVTRGNKAKDFETGKLINYANFGKNNEIQYDHIFPKSKLDKFLKKRLEIEKQERKRLVNEIANMAFMTKKGNLIKRNGDPASYFPRVLKKRGIDYFGLQQVPYEESLLDYERYEAFLNRRAELIATEINQLLSRLA